MEMLIMFIGLVSGVCKVTWRVLRNRKISVLMIWVEILLSNATNRTGDLRYVELITWSCHCPVLHFPGCGLEWGAESRQGCRTAACSAVATAALRSQPKATGPCRPTAQRTARESRPRQAWQTHGSHVAAVLLAPTELVPNLCEAFCFCEPLSSSPPLLKTPKEHCKILYLCHSTLLT